MKANSIPDSADKDAEARSALWRAICVASDDVRHRFRIKAVLGAGYVPVSFGSLVPDVATWQLVEALNLLGVILRSEDAAAESINIFGKTGPIEIQEDGNQRYLWAQQTPHADGSSPQLLIAGKESLCLFCHEK
jgi:hypothetical protein